VTPTFGLRAALTFLVLIAIAPVFGVVVQASLAEQQGRVERAEENLRALVDLGAAHQERLIDSARLMLAAVAYSPAVSGGDMTACAAYLRKLQSQSPQALGTFGLLDASGRIICRANPAPSPFVSADRLFFRNAMATGRFSVGEFTISRASGRPVLTFGLPVFDDGVATPKGVAYVAVDVGQADENLRRLTLASGMTLLVADRTGIVIAAAGPNAAKVGSPLPHDFLKTALDQAQSLTGTRTDAQGTEWILGVKPIGRADEGRLFVAGLISRDDVVAPSAARLWMQLGALAIITFVAAALAWALGDRVLVQPVRRLLGRIDALSHDEFPLVEPAKAGSLNELRELDLRLVGVARRLAERALQRDGAMAEMAHQKNLLESVFEGMAEGVLVVDHQGRVLQLNSAARQILGGLTDLASHNDYIRLKPEALGIYLLDGTTPCPPEQRPVTRAIAGEGVENFRFVVRGVLSRGLERVIQGSARPLAGLDGRQAGAVVVFFDITAAWRAERELRESEARYRTLFEANPHPMWVYDRETLRFLTVNDAAVQKYGYTSDDFHAMTIADIRPPQDLPALHDRMGEIDVVSGPHSTRHVLRDGSEIWVEVSSHSLDYNGRPARMVLAHDVTNLLDAQLQLQHLNETLERRVHERTSQLAVSNKELESFSYSVSHDLRAPLQVIDGFGRALLAQHAGSLDDRGRHYLDRIRDNTRQMSNLIDDLLSLARVTRSEIRAERVDLSARAETIVERLRQRFPLREITVEIEPGMVVPGDPVLLGVLLENLIGNAWKFTSRVSEARVRVGSRAEAGETVFWVSDNGAGFDMAYISKLFTPFQRLHAERDFEGTGIGLATVHRIVARHGGRVWAEATPGQGATFHFTLPPGAGNEKQSDSSGRGQPRPPGADPDDVGREQCTQ
jgi:PAS domain S-box-containing protein